MKITALLSAIAFAHAAHALAWNVWDGTACDGLLWGTSELFNITATACVEPSNGHSVSFGVLPHDPVPCAVAIYYAPGCTELAGVADLDACLVLGVVQSYEITCGA